MSRGLFISLEGGEGTGKSTQQVRLGTRLENHGINVLTTREPGGSEGAEAIRKLLVEGPAERWDAMTEALLMYAARRDHVERTIKPALQAGTWVLSDRFFDSSTAYQGIAGGLGYDTLQKMRHLVLGDFAPDLTLILDMDPEEGLRRASARGGNENRFESKGANFHARLRDAFHRIAKEEPGRCRLVNAGGTEDEVFECLWDELAGAFEELQS